MTRILLVEDDPLIAKSLKLSLSYDGFDVSISGTVAQARSMIKETPFEFYILDVNLPDGTGFDICQEIRTANENVPIIMLTAKVDEESAVKGITLGADDYVRKPFGAKELSVRINRMLDRKNSAPKVISFGPIKMDLNKHKTWAGEEEINLGRKEFEILKLLVQKQGEVVTRDDLIHALGEDSTVYDRTVDSHLSHLRKKLRDAQIKNVLITPVYGVGYRLEGK